MGQFANIAEFGWSIYGCTDNSERDFNVGGYTGFDTSAAALQDGMEHFRDPKYDNGCYELVVFGYDNNGEPVQEVESILKRN